MKTHEKAGDAHPTMPDIDLDDKSDLSTIYECDVCNQHVTESSYEHQIVDGVLICSNLGSIIVDDTGGNGDLVEELDDDDGTHLMLSHDIVDDTNQQVIISLSGLKEKIF